MRFATYDRFGLELPDGHRYPLARYRLLRELLEAEGHAMAEPEPAPWEQLARVHDAGWLERLRDGAITEREQRAIGLPWSPRLVERSRRAVTATILAARDALRHGAGMSLGGGLHHAGRAGGRGFCVLNDVAVAIDALRRDDGLGRVLVVDLDAHQGEGTAELLAGDARATTLSLHARPMGPSRRTVAADVDVPLPAGTGDGAYLAALDAALDRALEGPPPALAFLLAASDPWAGDRLGRLGLTKDGLRRRDALALERLRGAGAAVCVLLAGGYAPDVADTVEINAATARAVAQPAGPARDRPPPGRGGYSPAP